MQVVRAATRGVLLFADTVAEPGVLQGVWAQWAAWQAQRWLKCTQVIRPLHTLRLMLHEPRGVTRVRASASPALCTCRRAQRCISSQLFVHRFGDVMLCSVHVPVLARCVAS